MTGVMAVLDTDSFLLGMAAGGGGGGNPNTVETYSGTTATVMTNVSDLNALMNDILLGNATAMLNLQIPPRDTEVAGIVIGGGLLFGAAFFTEPQDTDPIAGAAYFYTANSVEPRYGKVLFGGDWESVGDTDCILTIIHHPLP